MRRAVGVRRVGHAGTLDPFASGLLLILVGRATRLSQYLVGLEKSYTGRIRLGLETDTSDRTGSVTGVSEGWKSLSKAQIEDAMASLTGHIEQQPPVYSAKKTDGQRAYRLARRGEAVALDPTEVQVEAFSLVGFDQSTVDFRADVGSGTYLRALARDLGAALGCGAHLEELRRIAVGAFRVEQGVGAESISKPPLPLRSAREAVSHLRAHELSEEEFGAVRHGRPIAAPEWEEGPVALVRGGELIAVADQIDEKLKPKVVLVDG